MSLLQPMTIDYSKADDELRLFKTWFAAQTFFAESAVIQQLRCHSNLCPLLAFLGGVVKPDVHKHEFEIQGVFRADYVVGDAVAKKFVLVEFEGGDRHSIFGPKSTNQMRHWGNDLQRGFSQISDWSWAKNDNQHTRTFQNAFGCDQMQETYLLVCGKDESLSDAEKSRLLWRHDKTIISGSKILFMTYDDLVLHFEAMLDIYRSMRADVAACAL